MPQDTVSDFFSAALHRCTRASRWPLRLCWHSLRWAVLVLALLWALGVMAWAVLHWAILPHANDWRPWLEKEASKALGVELRIGRISVESSGWLPRMELGDVQVLDAAGRPALRLPRVAAVLSAQSLLALEPRFSQLLVDAPELIIRRDAQGRIFIAGLGLDEAEKTDAGTTEAGMDWLFSQPELAIVNGRVRWVDEKRADTRPLELSALNFVMRNGLRRHDLRLDATPPADWGRRFTLRGQFTQSLLKRPGEFQHWSGQLYAELPRADLSQLKRHVDLPFQLSEGDGAVRAWGQIKDGQPVAATLDLALRSVRLRLLESAPELDLDHIEGRLDLARAKGALSVQARQLGFVSRDNDGSVVVWPRSDWGVALQLGKADEVLGGEVNAQRLDFALMAQIAQRLPLGERAHQLLDELEPRGVLTALSGQWQGALDAPRSYRVKAQIDGLAVAAKAGAQEDHLGRPGLHGASLELDANERGGTAKLAVHQGEVELPGLFEDPHLPITRLSTQLTWKLPQPDGQGKGKPPGEVELKLRELQLQTPDLSGEFDVTWRRAAGATTPGFLDLSGRVQRVEATRVARYIPQRLPATRSYVSRAILGGEARNVSVRLKGELSDFPFAAPRSPGIFRVATQAQNVTLAYVPPSDNGGNWPAMEGVDAELIFERAGMEIKDGHAKVLGYELSGVNGGIKDLHHARVLQLDGNGRGAGADLLRFVRASPLDEWLGHALSTTTAQGPVGLKLGITIPLDDTHQTAVKGQLQLGGVDLKLRPELPALSGARGRVDFDRKGLQLTGMTARLLGGDAGIEGGTQRDGGMRFAVQGQATAEGLRRATELGAVTRLAQAASGQAAYRFQLAIPRDGQSELSVTSNLQGLALDLPAPGHKEADAVLPLRLLMTPTAAGRDELRLEVGTPAAPLLQAQLQRDISGPSSQVLRGALAVQDKLPALPATGVLLQVNVAALDLDAWQQRLGGLAGGGSGGSGGEGADDAGLLPSQISLRSQALKVGGRQLGHASAVVAREGANWRVNIDAEQLSGRIDLKGVKGGQIDAVQARLTRLSLPRQEAESVSELIDPGKTDAGSGPLPSLDIAVDDFELRGKRLGRLEVLAHAPAAARDWKLEKLQIHSPEATLMATGHWGGDGNARRRTQLDWKLDIADAGKLLERLGQGQKDAPVLRGGKGVLAGQVGWDGSPLAPHYASMAGALNIQLDTGTFLKAEPGVGRLLGVLSLQSLPRRFLLDFRDVFAEGFTFDGVTGDVKITAGVARSDNIRIRGLQAAVLVDGSTDLAAETQKLRVVVVPEVSAGGASLAYAAINPAIALGAFLAQLILSRPVAAANTREFHITGTWDDPKVEKVEALPAKAASAP
ncbi:YhdP family protein [Pelomonas sp. Root1237]|uniref:YhdP family protein n=1 Tax=Pelomonas sp. Root1237 TaxID=1736434 RepID=UPI000AEBF9C5|nr:YhdP family protein [Pelomonas sp. Root1237]